jgi:hypothetical protein
VLCGGEHLVQLVQACVQPEELAAALGEQVLAEDVPAVHLEHQPTQVTQLVFAEAHEGTALSTDHPGRREWMPRGVRLRRAAEAPEQSHLPGPV